MKTNKPHNFLLLALTAVFSCCSGEDYSDITVSGTPSGETSTAPLTITVTDGGYASLSGGSSTRASEVDYRTVFTEGDKIGVFAVKDNAIVKEVSNLCLTATPSTDANAALTWKSDSDETPISINGATYYAYYPYKSDLEIADLAPTASNADGFFTSVITNWTPAKHQSTYADYTAQDLMIAQGTAEGNGKSLSFSMSHQMALVVIDLPKITYTFTNTDPSIPEYIIDVSDKEFNHFTPYLMDNGMYRYLVHPSKDDALLSGSYTGEYGTTAWKVNTKSIPAGNYKIYKVDGGSTQYNHELASGDFFMKDGSLIAGSTQSLTPAQQAACIGIVFWVGDATAKDKILKSDHPDCIHGLVVALNDVEGGTFWQNPYSSVQDWLNGNHSREYLSVVSGIGIYDPLNNIQGYNNTKAIEEFNDATANGGNIVQAVVKVTEYRKEVPAPTNSSDWYWPSQKELSLLCGREVDDIWSNNPIGTANKDFINGKLSSINSVTTTIMSASYWSSTERSSDGAFGVLFGNGHMGATSKGRFYRVRCVLAF